MDASLGEGDHDMRGTMTVDSTSIDRVRGSAGLTPIGADREAWRRVLADVAVVTVTPFSGERLERIDREGMARNLGHLVDGGVRLLVAGGNTGEFAALSDAELVEAVATHVDAARDRARVIAGIGYRVERAIELGRAAIEAGADGLMIHHPIQPYASERGIIRYYDLIAAALPGVPLILYVRGPQMSVDAARRLADVELIVGVKMGQPDPERFARLAAVAPELAWVCGVAEAWAVPFWRAGAIGFTSGLANVAPRRSLAVLETLRAGDLERAEALVDRLRPIEELRARRNDANNVAVIKAAMDLVGLVGGELRPPLSSLDPDDRAELSRILEELELLP
jgi:4-hydroxy-tetrahydrodipicolinate synthase